jgi:hypothetical protein
MISFRQESSNTTSTPSWFTAYAAIRILFYAAIIPMPQKTIDLGFAAVEAKGPSVTAGFR